MKILSNVDFEKLVEVYFKSNKVKYMAKVRRENDPTGDLDLKSLDNIIEACMYAGDKSPVKDLKNLRLLATSGKLEQVCNNDLSQYALHKIEVHGLYKKGEIAFDISDSIMIKENGKRGTVIDYNPNTKMFIVALSPFEVVEFEKKDLEKVAKKV